MPDALSRLPKAEVHLHLEGTIAPDTLWAMARANHVALPAASPSALRTMYEFKNFDSFVKLWLLMCSCLRTPDDYTRMVDGFLSECRRQTIRYVELHFTPYNHERLGIGGRRALEIVTARCEPSLKDAEPGLRYQFERLAYFTLDKESLPDRLVFNRTITLKDAWAKEALKR